MTDISPSQPLVLNSEQIMGLLPHRYPFALVDRVIEHDPGKKAVALKNVTLNEPQFQGHFPERPLMPGVLIVEAMAQVGGLIDFPYEAIGQQMFSIELSPNNFVKEIAPARTFGFLDQLEELKKVGLIKGGALDNALVCNGDSWVNPPLRFSNEPVRHKLLDLIGDLAFVGLPKAQIFVYKGSHSLHAEFAASLQKVLT